MQETLALPIYNEIFRLCAHLSMVATTYETQADSDVEMREFESFMQRMPVPPEPWHAWYFFQECMHEIQKTQAKLRHCFDRFDRDLFAPDLFDQTRALLFTDLLFHYWTGAHSWHLSWPLVESVSCLAVDSSLVLADMQGSRLPPSVWIEWDTPSGEHKPWIRNARGLLVSRIPIFDAPLEFRQQVAEGCKGLGKTRQQHFFEALADAATERSCLGFSITAVLKNSQGLQFVTSYIGHEMEETVRDMFECHIENVRSDNPKLKEIQLVWPMTAIKLLLYASSQNLFADERTLTRTKADSIKEIGNSCGTFYRRKALSGPRLQIQPHNVERKPFRLDA